MFFRDVIGQEEIKRRLIQEVREGLDLIMGRLGRKDSAVEHWKGSFRTDR